MKDANTLIILIAALVLLAIILIFLLRKFTVTLDDPDDEKATRKRTNRQDANQDNKKQVISHESYRQFITQHQFERIENEVKQLRNEIFELNKTIRNIEDKTQVKNQGHMYQQSAGFTQTQGRLTDFVKQKNEEGVFYMNGPAENGFKDSFKQLKAEPGMTLYKFEQDSSNTAFFSFFGDDVSTKDALSKTNKFIDPVCDAINKVSASSKRIITTERGFVILKGDFWEVKHKAKIRYD